MYRFVPAAALLAAAAVSACSAKKGATSDSSKVAQAGASNAATTPQGTFDPATHTAVVHATEYAFQAPDTVSAGWTTFQLVNDGTMLHHLQIVRIDSSKTGADLLTALKNPGPPPAWAVFVGGPNAPDPHAQSEDVIDLTPGNYMLLCVVDIPGGIPHFAKGMFHPLTVTAAAGTPAPEPTANATIALADYNFTITPALDSGTRTIKVTNSAKQPHEVELVKLAPGKTSKDMLAWIANPQGPPPGSGIGGVAAEAPGSVNYFTVNLSAGSYALICFVPDSKDGKPHYMHGMVKDIKVG